MMGRTTLREVREALAAARSGEAKPTPVAPTVDELEALARLLEGHAGETSEASPVAGASAKAPPEGPNQALQKTGGA